MIEQFSQTAALARINDELEAVLEKRVVSEPLKSALHSAIFPAGKRIRPLLTLALVFDLGGDWQTLISAAISLELLHCASLIHDDLPALDNDDYRRGLPACHRQFGEATAILAGDCLMPIAIGAVLSSSFKEQQRLSMADELCRSFVDLCDGQQRDMLPPEKRGELKDIYSLKTGALFGAAFFFAAAGMDFDPKVRLVAKHVGNAVGVFFQVVDDYLDYSGLEIEKKRPGNSDARNKKRTIFGGLNNESAVKLVAEQERVLLVELDQFAYLIGQCSKNLPEYKNTLKETKAIITGITNVLHG